MRRLFLDRWRMAWALVCCALTVSGCAGLPRIDPTGEHVFVPPPAQPDSVVQPAPVVQPGAVVQQSAGPPWERTDLMLTPRVKVASIGSEEVLVAGVRGADGYLRTNERVEWQIAPGGVGQFVDFDPHQLADYLVLDFNLPRKITPTYVVTSTSRRDLRLTRGTPDPVDDVTVAAGQTWVTITSPVEGTSYVTVLAPSVGSWERRGQSTVIHWVDAQWQFPPPAINPAGTRHVFTTTVMRQTDQSPLSGWRVQYAITGGPPAGFAGGAQTVEVETDAAGRANAEIVQARPASGTNTIAIQVFKPGSLGGGRILVGSGATMKTWSAPGLSLRVSGPAVGGVGTTLTYRLDLSNPGDLSAEGITLTDSLPDGLSFLSSAPAAQTAGGTLQWQIGRLGPGQCCSIELNVRAERAGSVVNCAEAATSAGLRVKECASTTISVTPPGPPITPGPSAPPATPPATPPVSPGPPSTIPGAAALDLRITGPDRATVGDMATFTIAITNTGSATATGLKIRDDFDPGFQYVDPQSQQEYPSPLQRALSWDIEPGKTAQIGIRFRVARTGPLCHTVEITGAGGLRATQRKCLEAVEPSRPSPAPTPEPKPTTPPANRLSLRVTTPNVPAFGVVNQNDLVLFVVEISNTGTDTLTNVSVVNSLDPPLSPTQADPAPGQPLPGHRFEETTNTLTWTLATLRPGEPVRLRLECKAVRAAAQACNRVRATTTQGDQAQGQACVEVRTALTPSASGLTLNVLSLANPASVGRDFTYVIDVANRGQSAENDVALSVMLPEELSPVRLGTIGPTGVQFEGQTVRFVPVLQLSPNEKLTYRVHVLARKQGKAEVVSQVTSRASPKPVTFRTLQEINPPRP